MRLHAAIAFALFAFLPVGSAQALPFEGAGSGIFADPVVEGGIVIDQADASQFHWENTFGRSNILTFSGSAFDAELDEAFSVGALRVYNASGSDPSQLAAVDLLITLAFSAPVGSGDQELTLALTHTPASGEFLAVGDAAGASFTVGSVDYTLEFAGLESAPPGRGTSGLFYVLARIIENPAPPPPAPVPNPEPDAALLYMVGLALVSRKLRRR